MDDNSNYFNGPLQWYFLNLPSLQLADEILLQQDNAKGLVKQVSKSEQRRRLLQRRQQQQQQQQQHQQYHTLDSGSDDESDSFCCHERRMTRWQAERIWPPEEEPHLNHYPSSMVDRKATSPFILSTTTAGVSFSRDQARQDSFRSTSSSRDSEEEPDETCHSRMTDGSCSSTGSRDYPLTVPQRRTSLLLEQQPKAPAKIDTVSPSLDSMLACLEDVDIAVAPAGKLTEKKCIHTPDDADKDHHATQIRLQPARRQDSSLILENMERNQKGRGNSRDKGKYNNGGVAPRNGVDSPRSSLSQSKTIRKRSIKEKRGKCSDKKSHHSSYSNSSAARTGSAAEIKERQKQKRKAAPKPPRRMQSIDEFFLEEYLTKNDIPTRESSLRTMSTASTDLDSSLEL